MTFSRGPHQGCLTAPAFIRVDIGAARQKHPHRVGHPGSCRGHQDRLAFGKQRVGIGAGVQKQFQHVRTAVHGRKRDRPHSVTVGRPHVGAFFDQEPGCRERVVMRRPVERRGAVRFGAIDVDVPGQKPGHTCEIVCPGGVKQRCLGNRGARRDEQREQGNHETETHFHRTDILMVQLQCNRRQDFVGPSRAVDKAVQMHAHVVEQAQVQIRQRRLFERT